MKQAVILAGGLGTRLGNLTSQSPKPLLMIDGIPFIEYLIKNLIRFGFNDILLLVGHMGNAFFYLSEPGYFGNCRVRLSFDGDILAGTGGSLKKASILLEDNFLMLNGDTFFDINFTDFVSFRNAGTVAHLALREIENSTRYSPVYLEDNLIKRFGLAGEQHSGLINGGIYYLNRDILNYIPEGVSSLEKDVFPKLALHSKISGRIFNRPFLDIGIPDDFYRAYEFLKKNYFRPAVFFDRDGVLNKDVHYLYQIEKFEWIDGAIETIKYFNDKGYFVFVVTNQSGVARGFYTENDVKILHNYMNLELEKCGAHIDKFEYCPFHESGIIEIYRVSSTRRKPSPGMILELLSTWPIKKDESFLIGDQDIDIAAAISADIKGVKFDQHNLFKFVIENNL